MHFSCIFAPQAIDSSFVKSRFSHLLGQAPSCYVYVGMATDSEVSLTGDQHSELSRIAQSRSLPAGYVFRARLILMLAEGASYNTSKSGCGTTAPTISRWKQRFLASGLDGLDTSHPGQPASVLTASAAGADSVGHAQKAEGRLHALELPQTGRRTGRQQGCRASGLERGRSEAASAGALHGQRRSGFREPKPPTSSGCI